MNKNIIDSKKGGDCMVIESAVAQLQPDKMVNISEVENGYIVTYMCKRYVFISLDDAILCLRSILTNNTGIV